MVLIQNLEYITGNLRDAYLQCVPGTIQHVDQLIIERKTIAPLCKYPLFIANGIIYSLDYNGNPILRITQENVNPILNNIDDAFDQLVQEGNYHVNPADFEALQRDHHTVRIDLTKLTLVGNEYKSCHLNIFGDNYSKLNSEDRRLAECVYGKDNTFIENMNELPRRGMTRSEILLLTPDYVKEETTYGPIALVAWANRYYGNFFFNDNICYDRNQLISIRAVRKPQ